MINIFGLKILTQKEFEGIKKSSLLTELKQYLKLKKVWKIKYRFESKPKCQYCDENREISIPLPDGTTEKIKCSCDKRIKVYYPYEERISDYILINLSTQSIRFCDFFWSDTSYRYLYCQEVADILTPKEIYKEYQSQYVDQVYATKKLAIEAIKKIIKEKNDCKLSENLI